MKSIKMLGQPCRQGHGIAVGHAIEAVQRRDSNAHPIGIPDGRNSFENLQQKPGTVFDRTAIRARAFIGAVAKKLVDQVAIGGVDFNAIKAGEFSVFGGLFETGHYCGYLIIAEFARNVVGLLAIRRVHLIVRDCQRAGRHWLCASIEERGTRAAAVPELEKDFPALGMHGICHFAPTGNLGFGVNSGLGVKGRVPFDDHGGLRDDKASGSSLGVVFRHEVAWHMPGFGPATRERCHEDAVGHFESAKLERLEECRVRHAISFCW